MRHWLSIAVAYAALTLSACATPQTVGPVASDAEIKQEEAVQAAYLQDMRAKGLVLGGENRKSPRTRLEKAAAKETVGQVGLVGGGRMGSGMSLQYPAWLNTPHIPPSILPPQPTSAADHPSKSPRPPTELPQTAH